MRQNPFRGLRPFPEVYVDNDFFYSNYYSAMVRGRVPSPSTSIA